MTGRFSNALLQLIKYTCLARWTKEINKHSKGFIAQEMRRPCDTTTLNKWACLFPICCVPGLLCKNKNKIDKRQISRSNTYYPFPSDLKTFSLILVARACCVTSHWSHKQLTVINAPLDFSQWKLHVKRVMRNSNLPKVDSDVSWECAFLYFSTSSFLNNPLRSAFSYTMA